MQRCISLLTVGLFLLAACILATGFDLTDESHYLLAIWHPWTYDATISQFGFIYFPLSALFDHDVWSLRLSNLVISWLLSIGLFLSLDESNSPNISWKSRMWFAAIFASSTLFQHNSGLWTPSYNTLNFQGITCLAISLLWLPRRPKLAAITGGVAGALIFLAKPSSAVGAALIFSGALPFLVNFRQILPTLGIATLSAVSTIAICGLLIDGNPLSVADRIAAGWKSMKLLLPTRTLAASFRIDSPPQMALTLITTLFIAASLFVTLNPLPKAQQAFKHPVFWLTLSAVATAIVLAQRFLQAPQLMVLALVLVAGLTAIRQKPNRGEIVLSIALGLLPMAYAYGSGNNYWMMAIHCSALWIAAALMMHRRTEASSTQQFWRLSSALVACLSGITLLNALATPYRQASVLTDWAQSRPVEIMGGNLLVPEKTARFADKFRAGALAAGWTERTPLIDLTGDTPGAALLLNGIAPGSPWIIGGQPGSVEFAQWIIDISTDTLPPAWYLTSPSTRRSIQLSAVPPTTAYRKILSTSRPCPGHDCEQVELWAPIGVPLAKKN